MSKTIEKITQNITHEVIVSITCDICRATYMGDNWPKVARDNIQETEIQCRVGWDALYNGGGAYTQYVYDICPRCFIDKLVPLLLREYSCKPHIAQIEF